jgi:hypothetical protein
MSTSGAVSRGQGNGLHRDIPAMSDEECLNRLARAVREHDPASLDEVARLIARLAVTIE